jgi:hypothetical protein
VRSIREGAVVSAMSALGLKPLLLLVLRLVNRSSTLRNEMASQKLRARIDRGSKEPDIIGRLIDRKDDLVCFNRPLMIRRLR